MMNQQTFARLVGGTAGILLLVLGSIFLYSPSESTGVDFLHFWMVPQLVTEMPDQSVYVSANHKEHFEFIDQTAKASGSARFQRLVDEHNILYDGGLHPTASPFLYAVFGITQTGNFELDFWIYQSVSTFLLLVGVFALGAIIGRGIWFQFLLSGLTLLIFVPASIDFGVANTNRLQVGLVAIAFWLIARRRTGVRHGALFGKSILPGAVLLGLVTAFKVNVVLAPALIVIAMLIDRRWSLAIVTLTGLAVGATIGVLVGTLYFGDWSCWFQWRSYLDEIIESPFVMESGNYTFLALIDDPTQLSRTSLFLTAALSLSMAGTAWTSRLSGIGLADHEPWSLPNPAGYRYALIGSAGLLIPLLTAPVAWTHYFLMALPAIYLLLAIQRKTRSRIDWALWMLWAIGFGLTAGFFINLLQVREPTAITTFLSSGVLTLLVAVAIAMHLHFRACETEHGSNSKKQLAR